MKTLVSLLLFPITVLAVLPHPVYNWTNDLSKIAPPTNYVAKSKPRALSSTSSFSPDDSSSQTWSLEMALTPVGGFQSDLWGNSSPGSVNTGSGFNTNWDYSAVKSSTNPICSDIGVARIECTVHLSPIKGDHTIFICVAKATFCDGTTTSSTRVINAPNGMVSCHGVFTASGSCGQTPDQDNLNLVGGISAISTSPPGVTNPPIINKPPGVWPNFSTPPGTNFGPYVNYTFESVEDPMTISGPPNDWAQIVYFVSPSSSWNILSSTNLCGPYTNVDSAVADGYGMLQVFEQASDVKRFYRICLH